MALLVHLRNRLRAQGKRPSLSGASPRVQDIVHLYEGDLHVRAQRKRKAEGTFAQIGRATIAVFVESQLVLAFLGQMLLSVGDGCARREPAIGARSGRPWSGWAPTLCRSSF